MKHFRYHCYVIVHSIRKKEGGGMKGGEKKIAPLDRIGLWECPLLNSK